MKYIKKKNFDCFALLVYLQKMADYSEAKSAKQSFQSVTLFLKPSKVSLVTRELKKLIGFAKPPFSFEYRLSKGKAF